MIEFTDKTCIFFTMNHFRVCPLVKHIPNLLPKPCFYSRSSFNRGSIKGQKGSSARGNIEGYHEIFGNNWLNEKRTFSLIQPRSSKSLCNGREIGTENNVESSNEKLGCGIILLKNYISLTDQVEIVNLCQESGLGLHGFEERIPNGEKLGLHSMLLGPKWYSSRYPLNMVPDKILSLAKSSIQDSQPHLNLKDEISSMCPDHCIVKFYTNTAPLALHEEPGDWRSIETKPVVSISIGDTAEFFYGNSRTVNDEDKALLESGDVLIFDRNFGDIFLGLHRIIPNSAPLPILKKCMLKPGLLNLSFRELREF